ncbi:hypothetical protein ACEPAH_2235 [Sanghuangporus vaninii]
MASLETATIDDAGTQLAFIDSGAPPAETYTTLIIVHGHTYHAQNFSRLLPIAKQHNLRVIALNRRDYVGSTPYSKSELAIINSNDDRAFPAFLQARGLEIARFLVWVIKEKNIPRANADGKEGGLAVLGWSLGNLITMAFMRYLKTYPSEIVETIRPYLRTFYIYECGAGTLGYPSPEGGYHPLNDTTIPPRMRGIVFGNWVSSYYRHPYYSSPSSSDNGKPDRTISSLRVRAPERDEVYKPSTLDSIAPADLIKCVDPVPPIRSEQPFMGTISRSIMYEHTLGVLLLDYAKAQPEDPEAQANIERDDVILPDVKVRVIYGDASIWSITWNTWQLEKDLEKWRRGGRKIRDVRFLLVEGANHFLHWDDPELFLKTVKNGLVS